MTALGDALKKHGINPNENEFLCALSKFINNGGTTQRVRWFCDEVDRKRTGEGHTVGAAIGRLGTADTRPPISAGHQADAIRGQLNAASATDRDGTAKFSMPKGQAKGAVPAREPSKSDVKAMVAAKKQSAKAVLDLGILGGNVPGGPAYLELRVRDLEGMIRRQFSEGAVHGHSGIALTMLMDEVHRIGDVDPDMKIGDILTTDKLKQISRRLEMESLKPMIGDALKLVGNFVSNSAKELSHA